MIKYRKGNLLDVTHGVIAHGVNCQGVMGSGVAKAVRAKYPHVYEAYRSRCLFTEGKGLLGQVQLLDSVQTDGTRTCPPDDLLLVANCFTQDRYGTDKRYVNYEAIAQCFATLNKRVPNMYGCPLHIPKIGAGLAGGDWNVIEAIINSEYKSEIICWELT